MKKIIVLILAFSFKIVVAEKPKLIVGIVVDQMRVDYISRYENRFGAGGFKKLIAEGYFCKNTN